MEYTLRISEYSGVFSVSLLGPLQSDGGAHTDEPVASTSYLASELGFQPPNSPDDIKHTFDASLISPSNLTVVLETNRDARVVECHVLSGDEEDARVIYETSFPYSRLNVVPRNSFRKSPQREQSSLDQY